MRTIASKLLDPDFARKTVLVEPLGTQRQPVHGLVMSDAMARGNERRKVSVEIDFPAIHAWHLENVCVANEYILFDDRRMYVDSSIICSKLGPSNWADHAAELAGRIGTRPAIHVPTEQPVLIMQNEGGGTWGHYLVQNFPKALLFRRHFPNGRIALPTSYVHGNSNFSQLFDIFGVPRTCLVPLERGRTYRLCKAVLIDFLWTFAQNAVHPVALDLLAAVPVLPPPDIPGRGIFIDRQLRHARAIGNREVIDAILKRRGIACEVLGNADVGVQIAAWRSGVPMISVLGSDLANIVFGRPGSRILALTPAWFCDRFFYNLAMAKSMVWNELFCSAVAERRNPERFSSFLVNPILFERALDVLGL